MFGQNQNELNNVPKVMPEPPAGPAASQPPRTPQAPLNSDIYVMPEKFHPQPASSGGLGKGLVIALVVLVALSLVAGAVVLYDMWQKNQNTNQPATNTNQATNQNTNALNNNEEVNNNADLVLPEFTEATTTVATTTQEDTTPTLPEPENSNLPPQISSDSDEDQLTDAEEITIGSNSMKQDTDGDTYADGSEIAHDYNPLIPKSDATGKIEAAGFVSSFTTNFTANNFSFFYPRDWQANSAEATQQVIIMTATGEVIKVSVKPNPTQVSAASWYLSQNPSASISQMKSIETKNNLRGIYSPNGLEAYLADETKNNIFVFEYIMDKNGEFKYPNLFDLMVRTLKPIITATVPQGENATTTTP